MLAISCGISLLTCFGWTSLGFAQSTALPEVRSVAWSPDGTKLAVGSGFETCNVDKPEDYAIQIIDPETGDTVSQLVYHTCTAQSLEWDRFGLRLISSAGADPSLYAAVWDVENVSLLISAPPFSRFPLGVTGRVADKWSPGNSSIVSVFTGTQKLQLWSPLFASSESGIFAMDRERTYAADWSPDGEHVVTGHEGGIAIIWADEYEYTPEVGRLDTHGADVTAVAWGGDGRRIFAGASDGKIFIWNAETRTLEHTLEGHSAGITSLSLAPNFSAFASASEDGSVRVWNAETGLEIERFSHSFAVYAVEWSPDGMRLAYGGAGSGEAEIVTVSHPAPPAEVVIPDEPTMKIQQIAWNSDGSLLAIAGEPIDCSPDDPRQPNVQLLDGGTFRVVQSFWVQGCRFTDLVWSSDNTQLALSEIRVYILDVTTGRTIRRFSGWQYVTSLAWHPIRDEIAVSTIGDATSVISANTGNTLTLGAQGIYAQWSPDGEKLATISGVYLEGYITTVSPDLNPIENSIALTGPDFEVVPEWNNIGWRDDGLFVVVGGRDGLVWVYDAQTGVPVLTYGGHCTGLSAVMWRPGTNQITSADQDGVIRIAEDSLDMARFETGRTVSEMAWSPDGTQLAYVDGEGSLEIITADWDGEDAPISAPCEVEP